MPYSLIAFDMDGTLLNSQKQIDPATVSAVRTAAAQGKTAVHCTGRAVEELRAYRSVLPELRYSVVCSGAGIYDWEADAYLALRALAPDTVEQLFRAAQGADAMVHLLYRGGTAVQEDRIDRMDRYHMGIFKDGVRRLANAPENLEAFYLRSRPEVLKLNYYCSSTAERDRIAAALTGINAALVPVEPTILECSPPGVNKGTGLLQLCRLLGIAPGQSIAVGDSGNDLEMLRTAGLGIAMGNASAEIKAAAAVSVADCDHAGCAEAVYRYLLGH